MLAGKHCIEQGPRPAGAKGRCGVMLKRPAFTFSSHARRFLLPSEPRPWATSSEAAVPAAPSACGAEGRGPRGDRAAMAARSPPSLPSFPTLCAHLPVMIYGAQANCNS